MTEPVLLSWSGGKDSAMALHALAADERYEVAALVTTVAAGDRRVSQHGIAEELVAAQAEALALPWHPVYLPATGTGMASNAEYEAALERALRPWGDRGVRGVAHGDLFLEDVRAYREGVLARLGMRGLFPIWGRDSGELAREFVRLGFAAYVSSVDAARVPAGLAGRLLDEAFLADLPAGADPSGENGEYHSFVFDGPLFRRPVPVRVETGERREGRAYARLVLAERPGIGAGAPAGEEVPP